MKLRPSYYHSNRQPYNWLAYNLGDAFLEKSSLFFKGVIYDLGCGEAPYREYFLQYADEYIGVDWSESYHDTKADIVADLNQPLPISSQVADTVISLSVLEHLNEPQVMLSETIRILRPGGTLILQVPWQWWVHEAPYDFYRYSPYGLKYLLEKAGFTEIEVSPQGGFFSMWFLKFNYFTLRLIGGPRPLRLLIRTVLRMIWYVNQRMAPYLDRLDKNWLLEAPSYTAIARKPT